MAIGHSQILSDIVAASIESWKVRAYSAAAETADDAYYTLGNLFDGKVSIIGLEQMDSKARNRDYELSIIVTAKLMYTNKTRMLENLEALASNYLNHKITLTNGLTLSSELLTNDYFGFKWTFVSDGDTDAMRYVEVMADRNILLSELATLIGAAPADGTPDAGDILYAMQSMVASDETPAGCTTITVRQTGSGSYESLGKIRNAKVRVELLTQQDNLKRSYGMAVKTTIEVEAMQSTSTELALVDDTLNQGIDVQATLMDGCIVGTSGATTQEFTGAGASYLSESDMEDISFIRYIFTGNLPLARITDLFT